MRRNFLVLILTTGLLSGCIHLYRPDVQQGNVITAAQVQQLKLGMSRRQVQFILGTPLIADPFQPDRWDYYYYFRDWKKPVVRRHLTVYFQGDSLARIEGGPTANPANPEEGAPSKDLQNAAQESAAPGGP